MNNSGAKMFAVHEGVVTPSMELVVHQLLFNEYQRTGVCPPTPILASMTGFSVEVTRRIVQCLLRRKVLARPYGEGSPLSVLMSPEGHCIRLVMQCDPVTREPEAQSGLGVDELLCATRSLPSLERK